MSPHLAEAPHPIERVRQALDYLRLAETNIEAGRQALADVPGKGAKAYERLLRLRDLVKKEERALLALRQELARVP